MSGVASLVVGIVGLAVSGTGTAMSFAQANKAKKAGEAAEADAARAMERARKRLEVNYYEEIAIRKEPYELEREALLQQGAQAVAAGQESVLMHPNLLVMPLRNGKKSIVWQKQIKHLLILKINFPVFF
jgi:hypothetical protein